jgi:hypothetical protein
MEMGFEAIIELTIELVIGLMVEDFISGGRGGSSP